MGLNLFGPTRGSGASWVTEYNLDFTTQSTHDFKTGGSTQSWGGVTWTAVNAANADAMDLTNSTGLVIDPVSATDFNGATKTLPYVWFTLSDAVSDYALTDVIRIVMEFSGNFTAGVDAAPIAYMNTGLTDGYENRRIYNGGQKVASARWKSNARTATLDDSTATVTGINIRHLGGFTFGGATGVFSNPNTGTTYRNLSVTKAPADSEIFDASTDKVLIGAMRAASPTALSVTFTGFKIQRFK